MMIAMEIHTIAYSLPMGPLTVVIVSPLNKKEETVVEECPRCFKEYVILLLNVDILSMVVTYLERVKNESQNNINKEITGITDINKDIPGIQDINRDNINKNINKDNIS
jgi:hypothetical protein